MQNELKTRKDGDDPHVSCTYYLPDKEASEEKSSLNEFIVVMVFPSGKEDTDGEQAKGERPFLIKI
jgi:hypothetical protein